MKQLVKNRPTEIASGIALAGAITAALLPAVPVAIATVAGVACGFGPLVVSRFVDALRAR